MTVRALLSIALAACVTVTLIVSAGPTLYGQASGKAALMNPGDAKERAPDAFKVNFDTSKGSFVVEVRREWAPNGADRFYNLVKRGYFDGNRFYRVISGFMSMAQFGFHGDPEVTKAWVGAYIADDPVRASRPAADGSITAKAENALSNTKGTVAFTSSGLNRRSIFVTIHLSDNSTLDSSLVPFARVASGIEVVEKLYNGYGDAAPTGKGPTLTAIAEGGNAYLEKNFPMLDYIKSATIVGS